MGRERIEMNFGYGYGVSMRLDDPNYFSRVGSGSDFSQESNQGQLHPDPQRGLKVRFVSAMTSHAS